MFNKILVIGATYRGLQINEKYAEVLRIII